MPTTTKITVNRTRTPQEALAATGRTQYVNDDVVSSMPYCKDTEVEIEFFTLGKYVTDDELDKEYEARGLKPVDPIALCSYFEKHEQVENCIATHWKDKDGKWCYATISLWDDSRSVHVYRNDYGWCDRWWFAGVRKSSQNFDTQPSSDSDSSVLAPELQHAISVVKKAGYKVVREI